MVIAEPEQEALVHGDYGDKGPSTYADVVLVVALVAIPWMLIGWLIWTFT